jgi:hypothetical protein
VETGYQRNPEQIATSQQEDVEVNLAASLRSRHSKLLRNGFDSHGELGRIDRGKDSEETNGDVCRVLSKLMLGLYNHQ